MTRRALVPVVLLVLLAAACGGGGAASESSGESAQEATSLATGADVALDESAETEAASAEGTGGGALVGDAAAARGADDATAEQPADGSVPLPDTPVRSVVDRIIKEGTISIEVASKGFDAAFSQVVALAQRHGGDVVASQSSTQDDGTTSGSVTLRVPVDRYEPLLADVADGGLGVVRNRDIKAQDVGQEYVDLESRLRHLEAEERFYLGLLERAQAVGDAIAVRQQLDRVQADVEQARGRLQYLQDRTAFSTLTVALFEPGGEVVPADETPVDDRPSLARSWAVARDAFVNVVGAMLVVVLFLLPLLVPVAIGLGLWAALRRRRPAVVPSRATRPALEEREPVGAGAGRSQSPGGPGAGGTPGAPPA